MRNLNGRLKQLEVKLGTDTFSVDESQRRARKMLERKDEFYQQHPRMKEFFESIEYHFENERVENKYEAQRQPDDSSLQRAHIRLAISRELDEYEERWIEKNIPEALEKWKSIHPKY